MGIFRKLFGLGPKVDFKDLVAKGAIILDVRTKGEFSGGHLEKAINMPLDTVATKCSKFKKEQVIITCCASGMRSANARQILRSKGYENVYNGGGWRNLKGRLM